MIRLWGGRVGKPAPSARAHVPSLTIARADARAIPFVMATERSAGFDQFVGRWEEAQHRTALADGRHVYFIGRNGTEPIGFVILLYIVSGIPGLEGIHPYLLTQQFENWHGLLRTPTDWAPIGHSAWVCALYAGPALLAAYLVFLRRDVAGG